MNKIRIQSLIKGVLTALFVMIFLFMPGIDAKAATAQELAINVSLSNGGNPGNMLDRSYGTAARFGSGDVVTIQASENIGSVYVAFSRIPTSEWYLKAGDASYTGGTNGFLHEYCVVPQASNTVTMEFTGDVSICYILCFSEGEKPEEIQDWKVAPERTDFLIVSSHADDEILFLGGVLPTYAVERDAVVEVCYLTEFWSTTPIREHEKLDGLWTSGITYYPVCGDFYDVYADSIESARSQYSQTDMEAYLTKTIRRFKPQIIVTQDEKGEYGHGFHQLVVDCVKNSVEHALDETFDPESVSAYGVWDTPKTYLHLYPENQLTLDLRHPIEEMGGRTALEIAKESYLKHVSQQWCWFYVDDEYQYSCAKFGLYRTTVGLDTNNDMMDNIKTYAIQEKEEAEALEAQKQAELEAEKKRLEEEMAAKQKAEEEAAIEKQEEEKTDTLVTVFIVIFVVVLLAVIAIIVLTVIKRNQRRRSRRRRQ